MEMADDGSMLLPILVPDSWGIRLCRGIVDIDFERHLELACKLILVHGFEHEIPISRH